MGKKKSTKKTKLKEVDLGLTEEEKAPALEDVAYDESGPTDVPEDFEAPDEPADLKTEPEVEDDDATLREKIMSAPGGQVFTYKGLTVRASRLKSLISRGKI